jgi:hypothetical protein
MNNVEKLSEGSEVVPLRNEVKAVEDIEKGDLVVVRWTDASDRKAPLEEHIGDPSIYCKDWGIFLGVTGTRRRFLLIGKDIVEVHNEWGATRIPLELVEEVKVLLPRNRVVGSIREIQVLGRKVCLRKRRREVKVVRVA